MLTKRRARRPPRPLRSLNICIEGAGSSHLTRLSIPLSGQPIYAGVTEMSAAHKSKTNLPGKVRPFTATLPPDLRVALYEQLIRSANGEDDQLSDELRRIGRHSPNSDFSRIWRANCLLLADLVDHGWQFRVTEDDLYFIPPSLERVDGESVDEVKKRVRASLRVARDRQIEDPPVQRFIRRLERPRDHQGTKKSVLDLVDDGCSLAKEFTRIRQQPTERQARALGKLIKPVIQLCERGATCEATGLKLIDIWRYFRHTWSLEYRSVPGRQMSLLIRNAARPDLPVIGIATLTNPPMRLGTRDKWIGWHVDSIRSQLESGDIEPGVMAYSLVRALRGAIKEVRSDDLVTPEELKRPSERVILRLQQKGAGADFTRQQSLRNRTNNGDSEAGRNSVDGYLKSAHADVDWVEASEQHLFVRKRAQTLARLMQALRNFNKVKLSQQPETSLEALFGSDAGRRALEVVLAEIRKRALASQVADVNVCGAIAPYNALLGGKLVALLLASKEVRTLYRDRYSDQISLIASQIAGRPIKRTAELLLLTTSSLYGVGSSQYNRLKLVADDANCLPTDICWQRLGSSAGYGTVHMSRDTVDALRQVTEETHGARRVNYVFGEGSSPRLRQVREGLDALGIRSDSVLHHATPRLIYGCELVPHPRERVMGFIRGQPPKRGPSAAQIADGWIRRWLIGRISREETLAHLTKLGPDSIRAQLWADENGQFLLPFES